MFTSGCRPWLKHAVCLKSPLFFEVEVPEYSWFSLTWWDGQNNGKMPFKFCIITESNFQDFFRYCSIHQHGRRDFTWKPRIYRAAKRQGKYSATSHLDFKEQLCRFNCHLETWINAGHFILLRSRIIHIIHKLPHNALLLRGRKPIRLFQIPRSVSEHTLK